MAGIYIHIPFCKQKCHYCNFFSVAGLKQKEPFLKALHAEIEAQKSYLQEENVNTLYFGGGTPSLLTRDELLKIVELIRQHYPLSADAEITLEANPDDISAEYLAKLRQTPVNRLSIGIQSFHDDDLYYLNRVHSGKQAMQAIQLAQDAGFSNITADLIYGIPALTYGKWMSNLNSFYELEIPHLSAYALTVEEKTALHHKIRKKQLPALKEEQSIAHFKYLLESTKSQGFIHYEISNFALPGFYSKHNSIYWLGGYYLGLGPSAHSFNGHSRQWNVSSISQYIQNVNTAELIVEKEVLTPVQRFNEYVMTSLRTQWGCDTEHIKNVFGAEYSHHFEKEAAIFIQKKQLQQSGSIFTLTEVGKLFADGIAGELFLD